MTIKEGGYGIDTVDEVVSGNAQFGVSNSEIAVSRLRDKKNVVVIATVFQHSPLVFLTRRDTGIRQPHDFIGKRVKMTWGPRDIELQATLVNEGVGRDQFETVDGPGLIKFLFDPDIDVLAAYMTNEPFYYIEKQIEYNIIRPLSYGIDFYGDVFFARGDWARKHRDIVIAFKEASLAGWQHAMAHKSELIDIISQKYTSQKSRAHLGYEADAMDPLILQNLVEIGHVNPGRWQSIVRIFKQQGVVPEEASLDGFFFSENADRLDMRLVWMGLGILLAVFFVLSLAALVLFKFNQRLNREIQEKETSRIALVESEARFKAMFENIHSGLAVYEATVNGRDFICRSMNPAAENIEHMPKDRVLGKAYSQIFPENVENGLFDVMKRVYETGQAEHLPVSLYQDASLVGWRENYVYRLPFGEIALLFNDETHRKQAEIHRKHLDVINNIIINSRHSTKMLEDLLDAMLDIFGADRAWLTYPCDPAAEALQVKVERTTPHCPPIMSDEARVPMTETLSEVLKEMLIKNGPVEYDHQGLVSVHPNMSWADQVTSGIRMAIYPANDSPWILGLHRIKSATGWSSDEKLLLSAIGRRVADGLNAILLIQELMKTNQILLESEDRFIKIFQSSPIGIVIAAQKDLVVSNANDSFCRIVGWDKEELVSRSLSNRVFNTQESLLTLATVQQRDSVIQHDIEFVHRSKQIRSGRMSSRSLKIDGRQHVIITLFDNTEYKQTQNEMLQAQRHLAEQEKYALIGQVAGKMAHDFNNILGAIMGNAELSLMDCREEETRKTLELILDQTKRGRGLTKNLVAFAKDQEPRQEFFDINEKIRLAMELLKKDLEDIDVSTRLERDLPDLLADPGMVENALMNLVQNAIHAVSKTPSPQILLSSRMEDGQILVEVGDNGCGIPKEHEKSIYAPAFTLKNSRDASSPYDASIKGTGYGLFNVKKVVEKHKGRLWFKSRVDEGTQFFISLPVLKSDLTREEKEEIRTSAVNMDKKILLVEDESSIAKVQGTILAGDPFFHRVDVAHNGHMALDLFQNGDYDLISLDYRLPGGMSGMDVYKKNPAERFKCSHCFYFRQC